MQSAGRVNDFVIRFANVNGSGSASANGLVAKSIFRMGLPIGAKNMFPSNIQGLPTWYEVRVSAAGFTGRRGGVDLMVAMNPQTYKEDIAALNPGGFLLYDSTKSLPVVTKRSDIHYLGIPLTDLCVRAFSNAKQRPMLKNIVYAGALASLLNIDLEIVRGLIAKLYAKNANLLKANEQALAMGVSYAKEHFPCPLPLHVTSQAPTTDEANSKIMIDGNQAAALGCLYAGATVAAWYPITPSTSLVDSFDKYCRKFRVDQKTNEHNFAVVQAEDELAAIGVVLGASWNGARSFTATSGPGISLMNEFLGYAYYAELPAVIFNIQRVGPSTGMPTRTQQADLLLCAYASHGDTKHVLLFPSDPNECFEFAIAAFDLAERLQTPVLVLSDLDIGMNDWLCEPLKWDDRYRPDRGKVLDANALEKAKTFYRYLDQDGDGICYRTYPGTHPSLGSYFTRGSGHDRFGRYTEDAAAYQDVLDRLTRKFATASTLIPHSVVNRRPKPHEIGVIHFGSTAEPMREALTQLARSGFAFNDLRPRAFPFHRDVKEFIADHKAVIVAEQNRDGQLRALLMHELGINPEKLIPLLHYQGLPPTAAELSDGIMAIIEGGRRDLSA